MQAVGEAKQKDRRKQAFLKEHRHCCFCGGSRAATTVDHVPSIQMFSLRRRPKGLEFPACEECNHATRLHEQVAAMLGRVYPDGPTKAHEQEIERIMRSVQTNSPGVLEEMMPSPRQKQHFEQLKSAGRIVGAGALNCSGPLVNRSIGIFGAKLGLALYYFFTSRIIPVAGGVAVRWYSNFDKMEGKIPEEFLKVLGPRQTLVQGSWDVGDQFNYASAITENKKMAVFFSTFRKSFAVVSLASDDVSVFCELKNNQSFRPGQWS